MKTYSKKILIIYFLYLIAGCFFYLNLHINEFPNKYVFTDWLINYEGGFVRRGLLGHIIYETSNIFDYSIKNILFFFQIIIYLIYFLIFYFVLFKIKINFFWLLIIFSPILFLYPLSELEALGRKDIFVITLFLIFSLLSYKNLNHLMLSFLVIFTFSCLIHEITIFYIFHYLFVIYLINQFLIKEKFKSLYIFLILLLIGILLYLNLYQHKFVIIDAIVNSYNYENFTTESGSFSHIMPSMGVVFLKTFNSINLLTVARYGFLLILSLSPLIFFLKIRKELKYEYLNFKNILIFAILLSLPLYLLIFDWGRVMYINHNFLIIIVILLFKLNLFDNEFLERKIKRINKKYKITIFILVCMVFAPKILITDDLASFPFYRSIIKIVELSIIN